MKIMGSQKVSNTKPQSPMATDKKTIKDILKKPFQSLFQKNQKTKEKTKEQKEVFTKPQPVNVTPISVLLKNFEDLKIEKQQKDGNEEDEIANFTFNVIKDEPRSSRVDSQSSSDSKDSGFLDKCPADSEDEESKLVDSLNKLNVDESKNSANADNDGKKKKLQTVLISRGPFRNRDANWAPSTHPYIQDTEKHIRQINQVNRQTFSGGQVLVANDQTVPNAYNIENAPEISGALKLVQQNVQKLFYCSEQEKSTLLDDADDYVTSIFEPNDLDLNKDFPSVFLSHEIVPELTITDLVSTEVEPNPVEEFSNLNPTSDFDPTDDPIAPHVFLTPPYSDSVVSPMSASPSFYLPNNYIPSPVPSSSIDNSDCERFQTLSPEEPRSSLSPDDNYPRRITNFEDADGKPKPEKSTMTLKQFKDMQRDLAQKFSKKECCREKKSCRDIFKEHMNKLDANVRKNLCFNVAKMDLNTAHGVLTRILLSLSKSNKDEDVQLALFSLLCEELIALNPTLFIDEFGFSLLKCAVLRCPHIPLLTRYLVQCIRVTTRSEDYTAPKGYVFTETDVLGDNLLIACARAGDAYSDVLCELVRVDNNDVPLFNVQHANNDGKTALHVACSIHSALSPRLQVVHVLLQHAAACTCARAPHPPAGLPPHLEPCHLWKGDNKGGDTPLHLAVNSATCDLALVMTLFRRVDRQFWKRLAQEKNRSMITPLDYARSASKSASRQNYPLEVLNFLKKCR